MRSDSTGSDPSSRGRPSPEEEEEPVVDLSDAPSGEREDVTALVQSIEEDAKAKERALRERRERRSRIWYALLVVGLLGNAYLWVGQPTWLGLGSGGAPTLEEEEGMLRYRMYVEARRIDAFQAEHGTVPASLEEAGSTAEGIRYRPLGDQSWELLGEADRVQLVLHSSRPLDEFIGVTGDEGADQLDATGGGQP